MACADFDINAPEERLLRDLLLEARRLRADLDAALAQGVDLRKQNDGLRRKLSQQTEKVEALRELQSAQGLVKELS